MTRRLISCLERIAVALEAIAEKPPTIICASMDDAVEQATSKDKPS